MPYLWSITRDPQGTSKDESQCPTGDPQIPRGHQRTNPNAPLGFAKLSPEPSLCPGAWDGSLQELLLAVEKDVLTAGDDVNPLPAQPADGVAVEWHHRHLVVHLPAKMVKDVVSHHGVRLPLGFHILFVVQAPCFGWVARLSMVEGDTGDTGDRILCFVCFYNSLHCSFCFLCRLPTNN